uniref:Uncharacterized protein n=1 Tax=Tetraselmis chuii TaxID=63592 RepID=A0A7S1X3Q3_9CHLO|mmetsp:Transcript_2600/g.4660  ORF Transcript_2600/g.4660 Transcript_2600/m.4660 type:complete len:117 (+) Transcript_2600:1-351(+)
MARTKVLVGRTGAVLVNAMFLPPGSSLLELIPYNWAFMGLDAVYRNITLSVGDVGYSSWRAEHAHSCAYASPSDARFAGWDVSDCVTATCLEVHARAGIVVDIQAMEKRLSSLLLL